METEQYEEAVRDYTKLTQSEGSNRGIYKIFREIHASSTYMYIYFLQ
jgi:hypothetical protein